AMLGSMTLDQEVTGSYHQTFGGLAQRHNEGDDELLQTRTKERAWNRAGGPIGSVNRYGQIMIVVLPLALFRFWDERSLKLRALAAAATLLILSGVLLTYSRSSFLTLLFLLVIMTLMRYIRLHQVLITAAVFIIMITFAAPNYLMRMESLRGVQGLFSKKTSARPDAITLGRVTEMLAALNVFLDYPILGVGPGQYTKYYSVEYMNDPDIALRRIAKNRRAHTLYFELAAETGLIGIISFMAIVLTLMYQLWQARRRWLQSRPDMANMATAFLLSITAYLSTGVFAHFSYQRYYWLLLALAGAAIQIFRSETSDNEAPRQVSLEKTNMINQPSHSNCFESAIKISSDAKVKRS
ncbi:MAG: O-antigen ligase family protein, partial [bacterium]